MANEEITMGGTDKEAIEVPELGADAQPTSTRQCVDEVLAEYGTTPPPVAVSRTGFEMTPAKSKALALGAAGIIGGTALIGAAALSESHDSTPAHGPEVASLGVTPGSLVGVTNHAAVLAASPGCGERAGEFAGNNAGYIILALIALNILGGVANVARGIKGIATVGFPLVAYPLKAIWWLINLPSRHEFKGDGVRIALPEPSEVLAANAVNGVGAVSRLSEDPNPDLNFRQQFFDIYAGLRALFVHCGVNDPVVGRTLFDQLLRAAYADLRLQDIARNGDNVPAEEELEEEGGRAPNAGGRFRGRRPEAATPRQRRRRVTVAEEATILGTQKENMIGELVASNLPVASVTRDALRGGALNNSFAAMERVMRARGLGDGEVQSIRGSLEKLLRGVASYGTGNRYGDRMRRIAQRDITATLAAASRRITANPGAPAAAAMPGAPMNGGIDGPVDPALAASIADKNRRIAEEMEPRGRARIESRYNPFGIGYDFTQMVLPRDNWRRIAAGVSAGAAAVVLGTTHAAIPAYNAVFGGPSGGGDKAAETQPTATEAGGSKEAENSAEADDRAAVSTGTDATAAAIENSVKFIIEEYMEIVQKLKNENLTDEEKRVLESAKKRCVVNLISNGIEDPEALLKDLPAHKDASTETPAVPDAGLSPHPNFSPDPVAAEPMGGVEDFK